MGIFDSLIRKWKFAKLQNNIDQTRAEITKKRLELAEKGIEIEKFIHSIKPASESENFVPSFPAWLQLQENEELNIEEALDIYIDEYELLQPTTTNEPIDLSKAAARLKVLNDSKDKFSPDVQADLDKYIFAQNTYLMIHRIKWEVDQKRNELEKRMGPLEENSE